jgi:hypothetical protein
MSTTGWLTGLRVTADGTGIVSHAGVALVRALADNIGRLGPHQRPATGPLMGTSRSPVQVGFLMRETCCR